MAVLTREQATNLIATEAQKQGIPQEYWPVLVEVFLAESGGNTLAHNYNPQTSDDSYGPWQFNFFKGEYKGQQVDLSNRSDISKKDAMDPVKSTQVALSKIKAGLDSGQSLYEALSPWSTRDVAMKAANYQGSGEPWDVNPSMGPAEPMAAGGISPDELNILNRWTKTGKSSPALDEINKQIEDYKAAFPEAAYTDPKVAQDWIDGLTNLQNIRTSIQKSEGEKSAVEDLLDSVVQGYITNGVPAQEALAESQRLLTQYGLDVESLTKPYSMETDRTKAEADRLKEQFGLDVGAVTAPYEMKRQRAADDAEIILNNWMNQRTQANDALAAWNDRSAAYRSAADQAQDIFKSVLPFMVSRSGPHELETMKSGGVMNQLFNRLGMEYKPPEAVGTTAVNPADYANQALLAAGPQPSSVGAPPQIKTLTEQLGAVPELPNPPQLPEYPNVPGLPSVPQLPRGSSMTDLINRLFDIVEKEQSKSAPELTAGVPQAKQIFGPPVPEELSTGNTSASTMIPGIATPFDVLSGYHPQGGLTYEDIANMFKDSGSGIVNLLKRIYSRKPNELPRSGPGFYRNLGGY